jgi:hypothetical protein
MAETRRQKRATSYARVYLTAQEQYGYLRDLSAEGCRMSFLSAPAIKEGTEVDVVIAPDKDLHLPRVPAVLLVRWVRSEGSETFVGGALFSIPEESAGAWRSLVEFFQRKK